MDRKSARYQPLLIALLAITMPLNLLCAQEPVRVGIVAGIEREITVTEGALEGRFSAFYRCVFERVPGEFQFVEMPLAQLLYQLRKGGVAVGFPLVQTSERDRYADFGGGLFQTEYVYLFLEEMPPLGQTAGLTYAFVRRFVGDKLIQGENAKILHVSEWRQAVYLLKLGRADVVVIPWVLVDKFMAGFEGDYFVRRAAWVDLSLYVSHEHGNGLLTEKLRQAIRWCRYRNDLN